MTLMKAVGSDVSFSYQRLHFPPVVLREYDSFGNEVIFENITRVRYHMH
jgi:hypothetical protein